MECLIGIRGRDFVLFACDNAASRSICTMKRDADKTFKLSDKLVMAVSGDPGDASQFAEYIAKNIQLYRMRNGYDLSVKGSVGFTRRNLADSLRSYTPYHVNMLVGGYDDKDGASLYFMDYLASSVSVPFAVHGYGSYFSLSILDRFYRPDLTVDEAVELVKKCINEVATRLVISFGTFRVKVVDSQGTRDLENIVPVAVEGISDQDRAIPSGGPARAATAEPMVTETTPLRVM